MATRKTSQASIHQHQEAEGQRKYHAFRHYSREKKKKKKQRGREGKKEGASSALFFCLAHEKEAAREFSKEQNLKFILNHKLI